MALAFGLIGVIPGVFIAVAVSLLEFIRRAWRPHDAVLGRADGVKGYHDLTYYPEARQVPGLILYRFDAPLTFFNSDYFRTRVMTLAGEAGPELKWFVIDAIPISQINLTGLYLGETRITDAGLVHLMKLNRLRTLWLYDTAVTPLNVIPHNTRSSGTSPGAGRSPFSQRNRFATNRKLRSSGA